jgi:hypothetical protein
MRARIPGGRQGLVLLSLVVACGGDGDGSTPDAGRAPDATNSSDAAVSDAGLDDVPNVVFVTAMAFTGDLGGLEGADAICNDIAQFAALPGTYRAWLSTAGNHVRDRLGDARGWVRPDGLPFADRLSDLLAGRVYYPPVVTENETFPPVREVWSATGADGRFDVGSGECEGWTSASSEQSGATGTSVGGPVAFTDNRDASAPCDTPRSILCFGIDRRAEVTPLGVGRIGFVTRDPIAGSAGLVNFDGRCAAEAEAAGLAGTFLAMVALAGSPAGERFDTGGQTWVRPDGVRLYASADELGSGPILAPIAVTADGADYLDVDVWTGALDYFPEVGPNCEDWSSAGATGSGGRSAMTDTYEAYSDGGEPCTEFRHLYCLEN